MEKHQLIARIKKIINVRIPIAKRNGFIWESLMNMCFAKK